MRWNIQSRRTSPADRRPCQTHLSEWTQTRLTMTSVRFASSFFVCVCNVCLLLPSNDAFYGAFVQRCRNEARTDAFYQDQWWRARNRGEFKCSFIACKARNCSNNATAIFTSSKRIMMQYVVRLNKNINKYYTLCAYRKSWDNISDVCPYSAYFTFRKFVKDIYAVINSLILLR